MSSSWNLCIPDCPQCHGKGEYIVPILSSATKRCTFIELRKCNCFKINAYQAPSYLTQEGLQNAIKNIGNLPKVEMPFYTSEQLQDLAKWGKDEIDEATSKEILKSGMVGHLWSGDIYVSSNLTEEPEDDPAYYTNGTYNSNASNTFGNVSWANSVWTDTNK